MHNRNPISSLSRRLLVGVKTCEKYFMGVRTTQTTLLCVAEPRQSLLIMTRTVPMYNSRQWKEYPE